MKRAFRIVATGLLVTLAAALIVGIVLLQDWGGRIETTLMVYGDQVWVTLDAGRPRILLLLLVPGVLVGAVISLYVRRPGDPGE
jgi:hypothetical protein